MFPPELSMRRLAPVLLAGLLAACANPLAARKARMSQLIGKSETDLVQAMGVPVRTYETGGTKFLAYEERRIEIVPGSPFAYGSGPYPGFYGGMPTQVLNLVCDTTFTVVNGAVTGFSLRGNACG